MEEILKFLDKPEDEFHDFKLKWHEDNGELVRDILNFINTIHHEDCYIFFGVGNDGKIEGIEGDENRKDTEQISDLFSNLYLAINTRIELDVTTVNIDGKKIDILTIYDTNFVPQYLTKRYQKLNQGLIYSRNGAINTPINESAPFEVLNSLFKKHNLLDVSINEQYHKVLEDYLNWDYYANKEGYGYFYRLNPDFNIKIVDDEENRYDVEAYSLDQFKSKISWYSLELRYRNVIIEEKLVNYLDEGRIVVPSPNRPILYFSNEHSAYYSILKNSMDYKLLEFFRKVGPLWESFSGDNFIRNIVIFENEEERDNIINNLGTRLKKEYILDKITPTKDDIKKLNSRLKAEGTENIGSDHELRQYNTTKLINEYIEDPARLQNESDNYTKTNK